MCFRRKKFYTTVSGRGENRFCSFCVCCDDWKLVGVAQVRLKSDSDIQHGFHALASQRHNIDIFSIITLSVLIKNAILNITIARTTVFF